MADHHPLSISGAHRWMHCPGSVSYTKDLPDESSAYAHEGTCAHAVSELALKSGNQTAAYTGRLIEGVEVTEQMAHYTQMYVDFVNSLSGTVTYEQRVSMEPWIKGGFGTADCIAYTPETGRLTVVDLKYGYNVVYATDNPQGQGYALGAYEHLRKAHDIQGVEIVISQPRQNHHDTWTISVDQLLEFGEQMKNAAEKAMDPDAPRIPGPVQCKWCLGRDICPELASYTTEMVADSFEDLTKVETLPVERIGELLPKFDAAKAWMAAIEKRAYETLRQGGHIPGHKLVLGKRPARKWVSTPEAAKRIDAALGADARTSKLITPTQAEKLLKKKFPETLGDLVVHGDPSQKVVTNGDPRPAIGQEFPIIN